MARGRRPQIRWLPPAAGRARAEGTRAQRARSSHVGAAGGDDVRRGARAAQRAGARAPLAAQRYAILPPSLLACCEPRCAALRPRQPPRRGPERTRRGCCASASALTRSLRPFVPSVSLRAQRQMGVPLGPAPLMTDRAAYLGYLEARPARPLCHVALGFVCTRAALMPGRPIRCAQGQLETTTAACMQLQTLEARVAQARAPRRAPRSAQQRGASGARPGADSLSAPRPALRSSPRRARGRRSARWPWRG